MAFAFPVLAADAPNAGNVLRELQLPSVTLPKKDADVLQTERPASPVSAPSTGLRITLSQIRVVGATVYTEAQLLPLVQDAIGKQTDLAGLEDLAARITHYYRERGYAVASAYLPAQDIKAGVVQIAVTEGRYGEIHVNNSNVLHASIVPLASLAKGDVIANAPLERALLLLSDLPGVAAKSTLQPGASVGTSDLVIDVASGQRVGGHVELDNFGSRTTGQYRLGGTLNINNPAGMGDLLTVQGLGTGSDLQYGRVAYQSRLGADGGKIGVAWSDMHYRLGSHFASLDANGSARIGSLFGAQPLIRSRSANLNAQISLDDKRLLDRIDSTDVATEKGVRVWNFGLSGDRRDGFASGGISAFSATYTHGRLRIDSAAAKAIDEVTADTDGSFGKFSVSALRLQTLNDTTGLYCSYTGQWASKNLDSSEKFSLGGALAVRAYPQGEAPADIANLLTVELRRSLTAEWQLVGFIDAAHATVNSDRWPGATGPNTRTLSGIGLGLNWTGADGYTIRTFYAHKLGAEVATAEHDTSGRLWMQAAGSF